MKKNQLSLFVLASTIGVVTPYTTAAIKSYSYDENGRLTNSTLDNTSSYDYVYDTMGNQLIKYVLSDQASYQKPDLAITYPEALNKPVNPDSPILSWNIGDVNTPVVYDLYLSQENPPKIYRKGLTATELRLEYLNSSTDYYWKVVARDQHNTVVAETDVIKLTTKNTPPTVPVPALHTEGQTVSLDDYTLAWQASTDSDPGDYVVGYDVYFSEAGKPLSKVAENIKGTSYVLTKSLSADNAYQWKIVAKDNKQSNSESNNYIFQVTDFENDKLSGYFWRYEGPARWQRVEGKGVDNSTAWAATGISHNQAMEVSTVVHSVGGLVSFEVATSSEGADRLRFYIDGQEVGNWSDIKDYQHAEFLLSAGRHTLTWRYQKDSSVDTGEDTVWVDNLFIPGQVDHDQDGVVDGWEYTYFDSLDTDFKQYDAELDTDQDGLADIVEATTFTNPKQADTDGDGMTDGWEVSHGSDPRVADANDDADGDNLNNFSEFVLSDENYPEEADADKDGMPDKWEVAHRLNPVVKDNKADADNDGVLNEEEYVAGTDPQDSSSLKAKVLVDFENEKLGGYFWRYEGPARWQRVEGKGVDNSTAWAATGISHNQAMEVSTVVHSVGGLVSFEVATSSEGADRLRFYIDGQEVGNWSDIKDYQHAEFLLSAGRHTLTWRYQKDSSVDTGEDTVWVDNLFIPGQVDHDQDGVVDGWEYHYFNTLDHDLNQDSDEDGVSDFDEFKAGTNPKEPN
ncbi:fibronectin type III domain-containing protein [Endozoicomonas sp. SM1973]|uniref:Fibronectin type III domain-containing protein n=1 Tax=Spartinivicinus marinus TaxID=2994442 RepID=A0A853I766_9GAMM|nr:fibronectin type III domain-containing protein [Spartinivicinus marinus]NYZ65761.1 fibronectin type III domain-containing protein [Spartinivicinus marinus]